MILPCCAGPNSNIARTRLSHHLHHQYPRPWTFTQIHAQTPVTYYTTLYSVNTPRAVQYSICLILRP